MYGQGQPDAPFPLSPLTTLFPPIQISLADTLSSLQSRHAYDRGDGAAAHELSEEGKRHGAMMEQYNQQASDYSFRENNAVGRVDGDTIDLHGQFVEEAERILEQRIQYARNSGQDHLHVYVVFSWTLLSYLRARLFASNIFHLLVSLLRISSDSKV